jgi:hypothetical protein
MPLSYAIDPTQRLVTISGEYADADEWARLLNDVLRDPMREAGFGFLRDLRGATKPVDAATVVQIVAVVRRLWPLLQPTRAAILTPHRLDAAAFVAQALSESQQLPLRVFQSFDEAIAWLNGDEP